MNNVAEIAEGLGLKKSRHQYFGVCPVCGYPDSFSLTESKTGRPIMHCFAGDCSWPEMRRELQSRGLWGAGYPPLVESESRPRKQSEADTAAFRAYAFAKVLWEETIPAKGTLVQDYLNQRGIFRQSPKTIRFHPALHHRESGRRYPAMVALVEHPDLGDLVAIHRTFLDPHSKGKAPVTPCKMRLGMKEGASVHLAEPSETLAICEGIETGLSVQEATGIPVWAALNCGSLVKMYIPDTVRKLVICADHDKAGLRFAFQAAQHWQAQGLRVRLTVPPTPGSDFNDLLRQGGTF